MKQPRAICHGACWASRALHGAAGLQVYTLSMLDERLNAMYKSMTDGRFTDVLRQTNALLHMVALTVVDTRREVDELKDLLNIVK